MIYCSQPRALKSTATTSTREGAREAANERKGQKRVKGKGKEGMTMARERERVGKDKQSQEGDTGGGRWVESGVRGWERRGRM